MGRLAVSCACFVCVACSGYYRVEEVGVSPLIPNMDQEYVLYHTRTGERIGVAVYRVSHYLAGESLFYKVSLLIDMEWIDLSGAPEKLLVDYSFVCYSDFRLLRFEGSIENARESLVRSGFYQAPSLLVKEDAQQYRIYAPNGVYSSLIEQYLVRYVLRDVGDSVVYKVFNFMTLEAEDEELLLYGVSESLKELRLVTGPNERETRYWFDPLTHTLIFRKDFDALVLWALKNLPQKVPS